MIQNVIARRYAKSLVVLANDNKLVDEFGTQLGDFVAACNENPALLATLSNRFFDLIARERIVREICTKLGSHDLIVNFIKLLIRKGRIEFLREIHDEYLVYANQLKNRCEMLVESAVDLGEKNYAQLSEVFSARLGKSVIVKKRINTDLIGGARVVTGGHVYDYSVKHQMESLKEKLMRE